MTAMMTPVRAPSIVIHSRPSPLSPSIPSYTPPPPHPHPPPSTSTIRLLEHVHTSSSTHPSSHEPSATFPLILRVPTPAAVQAPPSALVGRQTEPIQTGSALVTFCVPASPHSPHHHYPCTFVVSCRRFPQARRYPSRPACSAMYLARARLSARSSLTASRNPRWLIPLMGSSSFFLLSLRTRSEAHGRGRTS
ncbi:hypothetical protein BGZ61DRAFT_120577 [Ilyonectria robusta]|uniref:uncharacterized protein n=1 Tax=Ilyonectria robusta TaxID=1079257 RepID=UPI001E8EB896|nr:uncharacterized protein BGZ61DRAFT_120577 [Ilyonectria robusta]KAH8667304.1 hypothetical protein BGZ61DRAFT_120577 [Ilyonectria robusta]